MTPNRLLPEGWRWVRFGDVVRQVKDRVDPKTAGLDRYVAGEHMETDELRIRRWGEIGDGYLGPAFHMRFRPGQVLYGSRRTYLRKVAIADFEGICANTTFVIEPSTNDLLPEFLPLVMTAEAFHEHSIKQSKGSVNPYINFKDLTWYEFALPPVPEQRELALAVGVASDVVEHAARVVTATEQMIAALIEAAIWDAAREDWAVPLVPTRELLREAPRNGVSPPSGEAVSATLRSVSISAVQTGRFVASLDTEKWCLPVPNADQYRVEVGDVFAVRGNGNRDLVGRVGLAEESPDPDCVYPDLLIRLRFDSSKLEPALATAIWNSPRVHSRLLDRAKSSNGIYKVNGKDIGNHLLPVPSLALQTDLMRSLEHAQGVSRAAGSHKGRSALVAGLLREHLLQGGATS